ncbi:glycoside hydrolase family 15 protein [uncultured Paenibacillus sp.]|uniref:glycoside hydrolase family 15 protein n=1 Tax=uncultured Paenibacillus sp. TaxID=227322 RepID=UPI0028D0447D|nr:glycoside hydrolase family 15 protein [uncultured Paenibacillus sp.]
MNTQLLVHDKIARSYEILDTLKLENGLFLAAPSNDYAYVWIRDNVYVSLAYLDKPCRNYEGIYHRWLDMLKEYEWKLDIHCLIKPVHPYEFIHARYSKDVQEIHTPWGHAQNDAIGGLLFGIGEGIKKGKTTLRDDHDVRIVEKLVQYLHTLEYWKCGDSGAWEENVEVRSSSIAACVAGLRSVQGIVDVPQSMIDRGMTALYELFPYETPTRKYDLAQLSLIYPYRVFGHEMSEVVLKQVEDRLVRDKGVIRYECDSYYSTYEKELGRYMPEECYRGTEAEWCFGFAFLALAWMQLGDRAKAEYYLRKQEEVMLEDGSIPELYYSRSNAWNGNTPLAWTQAMYIVAKQAFEEQ